jgi:hypothetical protein
VLVTLVLAGCERESIRVYQAPKETAPQRQAMSTPFESRVPQIHWKLPAGWQELPAGQMRVGQFAVSGQGEQKAEVTIIPLPGLAGGDLDNVNRWRAQVGLPPVKAEELPKLVEDVQVGGQAGSQLYDFVGTPYDRSETNRLLVAVFRAEGTAWFFKMLGDSALVAAQKPAFVEFLKNVTFEQGAPHPPIAAAAPPDAPSPPGGGDGGSGKPTWTVPAGWQEQAPGPMQTAKFSAPDPAGGKAEITVVVLPGDAGGTLANVNRWRGQIGLAPVGEAELNQLLTPFEVAGAQAVHLDMTAEGAKRRLVAAVVSRGGNTWFYKLVGDEAVVGKQKEAFLQFVRNIKYGS